MHVGSQFFQNKENSDVLHEKKNKNLTAVCRILAKIACDMKNVEKKSFIGLGSSLVFSGFKSSRLSSKLILGILKTFRRENVSKETLNLREENDRFFYECIQILNAIHQSQKRHSEKD